MNSTKGGKTPIVQTVESQEKVVPILNLNIPGRNKLLVWLDRVLYEILFEIITVTLFVMWCIWDNKIVENIKRWIEKYVYDASEILCEII